MPNKYKEFYKRNLPHYQVENGIYAITFRLAGTLPKHVIDELKQDKQTYTETLDKLKFNEKAEYKKEFGRNYYQKFDKYLNSVNVAPHWLTNPDIAGTIIDVLRFNDKKKYTLIAFCIMPNHVHLIISPMSKDTDNLFSLSEIMHSIKTYSAKKCNEILSRTGQFWHHESYDHLIRDYDDFSYHLKYIWDNPLKAGLVINPEDWKYSWVNEEYLL